MIRKILGVNVDHIATLRNARSQDNPNLIELTQIIIQNGADQITAHLREDRRHIKDQDMIDLKNNITVPLNMEMAPTSQMVKIALQLKPNFVCLVPEKREEITTEGGLDIYSNYNNLLNIIPLLQNSGIKVSLFVDPDIKQMEQVLSLKPDAIEINTGLYSLNSTNVDILNNIKHTAKLAYGNNIRVHCGHGLNFDNIKNLKIY